MQISLLSGSKSECFLNSKSLHTALNIYVGNLKQTILVCWTSQTLLYLICKDGCVVVFSRSSWWPEIPVSGSSFTSQSNRLWMTPVLHNCYRASVRTYQHRSDGDRPDFRRRRWRPTCFSSPIYCFFVWWLFLYFLESFLVTWSISVSLGVLFRRACQIRHMAYGSADGMTAFRPVCILYFLWTTHSAWRTLFVIYQMSSLSPWQPCPPEALFIIQREVRVILILDPKFSSKFKLYRVSLLFPLIFWLSLVNCAVYAFFAISNRRTQARIKYVNFLIP